MKYILDSSVAFKWLVLENDTAKALRLRDDFRSRVVELLAPDILPVEVVHSLTRAERQGRVTPHAEREGCELVTADDKLVKSLLGQFPFIVPLASLP
jgi:predicted nucleic acid-binding protein